MFMGTLGQRRWYRCRYCDWEYSHLPVDDNDWLVQCPQCWLADEEAC